MAGGEQDERTGDGQAEQWIPERSPWERFAAWAVQRLPDDGEETMLVVSFGRDNPGRGLLFSAEATIVGQGAALMIVACALLVQRPLRSTPVACALACGLGVSMLQSLLGLRKCFN